MEDIFKSNFIESVKGAEKSIFMSCLVSITLYGLALLKKIETVTVPILDVKIEGSAGLMILLLLYGAIGIHLCMYAERAKKNLTSITSPDVKKALIQYPSIACGSKITRIASTLLPIILFGIAMDKGFEGNWVFVIIMLAIFSSPYLVALTTFYEVNA
jgi:hypothetical protein